MEQKVLQAGVPDAGGSIAAPTRKILQRGVPCIRRADPGAENRRLEKVDA